MMRGMDSYTMPALSLVAVGLLALACGCGGAGPLALLLAVACFAGYLCLCAAHFLEWRKSRRQ